MVMMEGGENGVVEGVEGEDDDGWVGGNIHEAGCFFVLC